MSGTGNAYDFTILANQGVADVAYSADQQTLYAATGNGRVLVYDVDTHQLLDTWDVGDNLGGVSATEDGKYLLAVELSTSGKSTLYRIDTSNGSVETYKVAGSGFEDVEVIDDRTAILTGGGIEYRFDLESGAFTTASSGLIGYDILAEDDHLTLAIEIGSSGGGMAVFDDRTGTIVATGGNAGFNFGSMAISEAAQKVIVFNYYSSMRIYDLDLNYEKTVDLGGRAEGMAFDSTGEFAYVYLIDPGQLAKFDTKTWKIVETFEVGASGWHNNYSFGNQILIDDDGKHISILDGSTGTLRMIDLTVRDETFLGTDGADSFSGGKGDDIYVVNDAGDVIAEKVREGADTAKASVDYALAANIETLVLTGPAVAGTGNLTANLIRGNGLDNALNGLDGADTLLGGDGVDSLDGGAGKDLLDGGAGDDLMAGGAGDDTYLADSSGDRAIEAADGGVDEVRASVSYTLRPEVETLSLTGRAEIDGTGNRGDNLLVGNSAANVLIGLDGDDVLRGLGGDDRLEAGRGRDLMAGGQGDDLYIVSDQFDAITEVRKQGIDTVESSISYILAPEVENLTLTGTKAVAARGNDLDNILTGNTRDNFFVGGRGADVMIGGEGSDTFSYTAARDSGPGSSDLLADFTADDRIDLLALDADGPKGPGGTFVRLAGDGDFTAAGQLRLVFDGVNTRLELNMDKDADAEMVILLAGDHTEATATDGWVL